MDKKKRRVYIAPKSVIFSMDDLPIICTSVQPNVKQPGGSTQQDWKSDQDVNIDDEI